jgi:two-component system chemotaxis sensor kinase CheA
MDPMDAIKQTFLQECEEQLAELEAGLLAMQTGEGDSETVNAVFRAVHSVKGGAGAFGMDDLVRFAHVFETCLDKVRSDKLVADASVLKILLRAADVLADLVRAVRDGGKVDAARSEALCRELNALHEPGGAAPAAETHAPMADDGMDGMVFAAVPIAVIDAGPAEQRWTIRFRPLPVLYAKANEAALLLRELGRLGPTSVVLDASGLPPLPELEPEGAYLAWTVTLTTAEPEGAIRDVFDFVDGDCELDISPVADAALDAPSADDGLDVMALIRQAQAGQPAAADLPPLPGQSSQAASQAASQTASGAANEAPAKRDDHGSAPKPTIRVDLDRVDRLIDLVGELVINQAMLAQCVIDSGVARSSKVTVGLDDLEQLTREIQDSVMAIRAQPVKSVFQRLPRLARELAAMTGKQVRLVTEGEGTEVDKTVIEHLSDPLTHMIRNAIDHGLEKPEVRIAAGKSPEGLVRLAALHRSGRIVIEISDDGAGINRTRVRQSAIEKGLIAADAVMSDEEIDNIIFMPGFSTAATVSDISGRGVGMDVVRRSIQSLGGRISIASREGRGSTFTMSLPLTLAVLDGMVVSVEGQTLVVPLTAIIETLQPRPADVHGLGDGARVISIRGSYVPLIDVGVSLGYRYDPMPAATAVALLIENEGGTRAALLVDAIQGQRQVVIKSLEANYRHVPGVAAATILGDGRVALILDIDAIVAASRMDGSLSDIGAAYA